MGTGSLAYPHTANRFIMVALLGFSLGCSEASSLSESQALSGAVDGGQSVDGTDGPTLDWPDEQPGADEALSRTWHRAGAWYNSEPAALSSRIQDMLNQVAVGPVRPGRAILTPHAGLGASGLIAAEAWARVDVPDLVIVLAPNHGQVGAPAAVWPEGAWLVPGVAQATDPAVATTLAGRLEGVDLDREAFDHVLAHPSEMQLPFLSRINPNAAVVFVSFFDFEGEVFPNVTETQIEVWGEALAEVIAELEQAGRTTLLVGTTDLSHYEPLVVNDPWDEAMMASIAQLDVAGLRDVVEAGQYTICGEIAASVFMATLRAMGYTELDWWSRGNSSHLAGTDSVVGYPVGVVWR